MGGLWPILVFVSALGTTFILLAVTRDIHKPEPEFINALLLHLGTGLLVGAFLLILDRRFAEALQKVQDAFGGKVQRSLEDRASSDRASAVKFSESGDYKPLHDLMFMADSLGSIPPWSTHPHRNHQPLSSAFLSRTSRSRARACTGCCAWTRTDLFPP